MKLIDTRPSMAMIVLSLIIILINLFQIIPNIGFLTKRDLASNIFAILCSLFIIIINTRRFKKKV